MEDLWRFGIPMSVRRVLWPFKIGNKLGISKELYQINRSQGKTLYDRVVRIRQRSNTLSTDHEVTSNAMLSSGKVCVNQPGQLMAQAAASSNSQYSGAAMSHH